MFSSKFTSSLLRSHSINRSAIAYRFGTAMQRNNKWTISVAEPPSATTDRKIIVATMNSNKVNALSLYFLSDFNTLMEAIETYDKSWPLVLTAEGSVFSAGLDLSYVVRKGQKGLCSGSMAETEEEHKARMRDYMHRVNRMFERLYLLPRPTVAAVNGGAIAGGFIMAICCDFRVVLNNPKFNMSLREVGIGLPFPSSVLYIVKQELPAPTYQYATLLARSYSATEALYHGIATDIADSQEELLRKAFQLALPVHHVGDTSAAYLQVKEMQKKPGLDEIKNSIEFGRIKDEYFIYAMCSENTQQIIRSALQSTKK